MKQHTVTRRTAFGIVVGASAGITLVSQVPAFAAASPDVELIRLGEELAKVWASENAAYAANKGDFSEEAEARTDAAYAITCAIVDEIETKQATTLQGVCVKAMAVSWCICGAAIEDDTLNDQATQDVRITSSVLRDLLAMKHTL